jgi:hypothetical protein
MVKPVKQAFVTKYILLDVAHFHVLKGTLEILYLQTCFITRVSNIAEDNLGDLEGM